jgi:hypothetical protein
MQSLLYNVRGSSLRRSGSLQTFNEYRDNERKEKNAALAPSGFLEYETLELRVHPPNVEIDNSNYDDTKLTIDSANRPGTLVEVRESYGCVRTPHAYLQRQLFNDQCCTRR